MNSDMLEMEDWEIAPGRVRHKSTGKSGIGESKSKWSAAPDQGVRPVGAGWLANGDAQTLPFPTRTSAPTP